MRFRNDLIKKIVRLVSKDVSVAEAIDLQHELMLYDKYQADDRATLIDEIANEVLSRISVSVDATDAIADINSLRKALRDF